MDTHIASIGKEYNLLELRETDVDPSPFKQFEKWFDDALRANLLHPNAMTLATATKDGRSSARMMLLKGFDEDGFVFYTNSESKKGKDLAENPLAAIVFWWAELERQVRVEGRIEEVSNQEVDSYFKSRPRGSQLGAWASWQSQVIESREVLERRFQELEIRHKNQDIPRPPYWIGYRLRAILLEFWQGRPNRLHDRLRYRLLDDGGWVIERLAP
jgi:pyridoxamine 5'-phosphate oxidase